MDTKIVKIDVRNENNKEKIFSYFVFFKKRSPNFNKKRVRKQA